MKTPITYCCRDWSECWAIEDLTCRLCRVGRPTTGANNKLIRDLGLDPSSATPAEVRLKMREKQPEESEEQMAKLGLLLELLKRRGEVYSQGGEQDNEINQISTSCALTDTVFLDALASLDLMIVPD